MAANKVLTPKQERFCSEYLKDLNATAAYKRAGYDARGKSAEVNAARLLGNARVATAVALAMKERSQRTMIGADRVIRELARIAFLDIGAAFTEGGRLKPLSEMDEDTRRAISGLEVSKLFSDGEQVGTVTKIKLSDKIRALDLLGRHFGLSDSKIMVGGDAENPLVALIRAVQGTSFNPVVINGDKAA